MNYIEKFCRKHPNFGVENLMKYIAIANVVFWLVGAVNPVLLTYITFNPAMIMRGQIWRMVSFMFYPASTGLLALIAVYFYYWLGSTLERVWGTAKFNVYFFMSVLLTEIYCFAVYFIFGISFSVTSAYIYLGMFFAFAALFPDMQVLLFFIIPIKMKYLAIVDGVFFLMGIIQNRFPANLLPVMALLNFFVFFGRDLLNLRPRKPSANTVNFRKESARIKREQSRELYKHRCAVCGRTDKDHPELEFRYCSRCEGYHCFCMDHINNHIHFTE